MIFIYAHTYIHTHIQRILLTTVSISSTFSFVYYACIEKKRANLIFIFAHTYIHTHTTNFTYNFFNFINLFFCLLCMYREKESQFDIHICTHICTHAHTHTCTHVHTHACAHTCTCTHMHVHTYTYIHVHTHTCTL